MIYYICYDRNISGGYLQRYFIAAIFTPNMHLHKREVTMTKTVSKNQYADSRDFMTSLLFRKWTIASIVSLGAETKRYSMLYRFLPGVIQKVLTEHFKQLERAGIIRCFAQLSFSQSAFASVYTLHFTASPATSPCSIPVYR